MITFRGGRAGIIGLVVVLLQALILENYSEPIAHFIGITEYNVASRVRMCFGRTSVLLLLSCTSFVYNQIMLLSLKVHLLFLTFLTVFYYSHSTATIPYFYLSFKGKRRSQQEADVGHQSKNRISCQHESRYIT